MERNIEGLRRGQNFMRTFFCQYTPPFSCLHTLWNVSCLILYKMYFFIYLKNLDTIKFSEITTFCASPQKKSHYPGTEKTFFDVLREYRNETLGWNGLKITALALQCSTDFPYHWKWPNRTVMRILHIIHIKVVFNSDKYKYYP